MYSRGILGKYFTKRFGPNTMLHVWQNIHGMQPLPAIDLTLHQIPSQASSLAVAFAEWTLWNYYTGPRADTVNYYNESPLFPVIVESYFDLISPTQQITGNISLPRERLLRFCVRDGHRYRRAREPRYGVPGGRADDVPLHAHGEPE